jgi:hypothetical protein
VHFRDKLNADPKMRPDSNVKIKISSPFMREQLLMVAIKPPAVSMGSTLKTNRADIQHATVGRFNSSMVRG